MRTRRWVVCLTLIAGGLLWGLGQGRAATKGTDKGSDMSKTMPKMRRITQADRKAAAARKKAQGMTQVGAASARGARGAAAAPAAPAPGAVPDYFGPYSNWANSPLPSGSISAITVVDGGSGYSATPTVTVSDIYGAPPATATATVVAGVITAITTPAGTFTAPVVTITDATGVDAIATATLDPATATGGIHKFVDPLPGLVFATPDKLTYPGSDYYEIELNEYTNWQFHTDLAPTKLRGYRQTNNGTDASGHNTVVPPATYSYLGPTIIAVKGTPTRIKFTNNLPTTALGGDLFIPTDTTVMGAGSGWDLNTNSVGTYSQNRATLHLHGGFTPWISDGTPYQWVTPTGEAGNLTKGVSTQPVPDMPIPPGNSMTFYWPNAQSGRLMFYHDHAYGITRLNVYAGEAAGYLLVDPVERALTNGTTAGVPSIPDVPLVIQDKTFVWGDQATNTGTWATDPTWDGTKWGAAPGSLWFPHVYMPNQNPWDLSGANAMGRWDYALWFWPPYTGLLCNPDVPNPYVSPTAPWEPPMIPGTPPSAPTLQGTNCLPNPVTSTGSLVPEAFMDTPLVNGKAYPTLSVPAGPVRFRILNAANDRFQNLSLFVAADKTAPTTAGSDPTGTLTKLCDGTVAVGNCTEVKMVPFNNSQNKLTPFPSWWYTRGLNFTFDDRAGGVPDPTTRGPAMIQIGTEGGLLPVPAVVRNQPINYTYNRRDIVVLSVQEHALFLGPAERADVIVDFSAFAGKTLILYNDSPAPVPAADQRIDYYTGGDDQTDTGGAPTTLPGYGPNTRTIMQIVVGGSGGAGAPDALPTFMGALNTALPTAFAASQDPIIVPQHAYNAVYGTTTTDVPGGNVSRISDTSLSFAPLNNGLLPPGPCTAGTPGCLTFNMKPKAIQELFEMDYGRMNATLGVELPFTNGGNQTTIPLGYIEPVTEDITAAAAISPPTATNDGTQIWKITHNGVDTHAIHVHLFNVQVINRVGWDGAIRPPDANELGWKETVRMNPLEDIIVALRPTTPPLPFGLPTSQRYLAPALPPNTPIDTFDVTNGNPITVPNTLADYGWEYVWHCHLLGHEENDMMRPTKFNVPTVVPAAPVLTASGVTQVNLSWTDGTPAPSLGNPANEIGFRIDRAIGTGAFAPLATVPANTTSYVDTTIVTGVTYRYRVVAFNASGSAFSNIVNAPIAISINDVTVTEGNSGTKGVNFTVSLSAASTVPVTFTYATTTLGTATPVTDFLARTYNLTFSPGQTSMPVTLAIVGDLVPEPTETVIVQLSNVVGAVVTKGTGTCTIFDNDTPPAVSISINDISVTEGNSGTKGVNFTISLSGPSASPVTFTYATTTLGTATSCVTASPGCDFLARTYNLTFNPGQTSMPVTLAIVGDLVPEPTETEISQLSNVVGATVLKGTGTCTIFDND